MVVSENATHAVISEIQKNISGPTPLIEHWQSETDAAIAGYFERSIPPKLIRNFLLSAGAYGILAPSSVDSLSIRYSGAPLSGQPEPEAYQPSQYTYWTLPMAMAWIATRHMYFVRPYINELRTKTLHWQQDEPHWLPKDGRQEGLFIERGNSLHALKPASVFMLAEDVESLVAKKADMPFADAQAILWQHLQSGRLVATGIPGPDCSTAMPREVIPTHFWQDLKASYNSSLTEECVQIGLTTQRWWRVTVLQADVLKSFPAPKPDYAETVDAEALKAAGCKNFFAFPEDPYLPLHAVFEFVETGWYLDRSRYSLDDLGKAERIARQPRIRNGSLLTGQAEDSIFRDRPETHQFREALANAVCKGDLRLLVTLPH